MVPDPIWSKRPYTSLHIVNPGFVFRGLLPRNRVWRVPAPSPATETARAHLPRQNGKALELPHQFGISCPLHYLRSSPVSLFLSYTTLNKQDVLSWLLVGLVLGIFGLPVLYFTLAMVLGTNINPVLLISTSTVILLAIGIGRFWRARQPISSEPTGS